MHAVPTDDLPLSDGVVQLRAYTLGDAEAVAAACVDPEIPRWTFMAENLTVDQASSWIEDSHRQLALATNVRLAIVGSASDAFIGQIGIGHFDWPNQRGEIYYWLAAPERHHGYTTRAVRLLTTWGFHRLGLARIELLIEPDNHASQRVAQRAGYHHEGTLRSYQVIKNRRMDAVVYSRLATDR